MRLLENDIYLSDIRKTAEQLMDWKKLRNSVFMISGATGMIGSFLVDILMYRNQYYDQNCKIIVLGRSGEKAEKRFKEYWKHEKFCFKEWDMKRELEPAVTEKVDFVFHAAGNTHPLAYAGDPIGTIMANLAGLHYLLDYARKHDAKKFLYASSNEIYGENRGDTDYFKEDYCGYIDCNTLRAGYPESKRAGEALCQAYISQKGMDIVIPRFTRTFGPTMLLSDTKAVSQFLKKGISDENIVLKSEGTQFYSYTYVADAVSGLLTCLFSGVRGEAYNIADRSCDIRLKDLAAMIAGYTGKKVVYKVPDDLERFGYSKATKALLDSGKLQALGWRAAYGIEEGLAHTIDILKMVYEREAF